MDNLTPFWVIVAVVAEFIARPFKRKKKWVSKPCPYCSNPTRCVWKEPKGSVGADPPCMTDGWFETNRQDF